MPLLWLSLAFLTGILLAERLGAPLVAWLGLAAAAVAVEIGWRLVKRWRNRVITQSPISYFVSRLGTFIPKWLQTPIPYSLLLFSLFLGGARYSLSHPTIDPAHIAWYNDQEVPLVLEGWVIAPPDVRDAYVLLQIEVERFHPTGELLFTSVSGKLLARIPQGGDFHYGDRLRLDGHLKTPFESEDFSYRDYLARQDIHSSFNCRIMPNSLEDPCARRIGRGSGNPLLARVYELRRRSLDLLQKFFPDPSASLLAGILLGIESGIPADVMQAFQATGTAHIIVISGFNFAIVAGVFTDLLGKLLGRWRGMLAAIIAIILYAVFVGGGAVVVRAAIMGGFAVLAKQVGRRQDGVNSLAFIAALMSIGNPYVLWDVGFQLSFAATFGLVIYADPLTQYFIKCAAQRLPMETAKRLAGPLGEYFLYTRAAQVMTLPVILYHFQRLSIISFLANPLILPVQPLLMLLGGLALAAGLLLEPVGQFLAYFAWPLVAYTVRVVEWLARWPVTDRATGQVSGWWIAAFFALLLVWTFARERLRGWTRQFFEAPGRIIIALAVIVLLAAVVWRMAIESPDGRLHLTMLDAGGGEALLIQTPAGRYILINGGASPSRLSDALGRRLPLGARRLDYLVVAGAGDETLAALPETIDRFPPEQVLWSGTKTGQYATRALQAQLTNAGIPIIDAQPGHALDLGQGARLEVLDTNSAGAVLWLEWDQFRALLPVAMKFENMQQLQSDLRLAPVTALLLADSGLSTLNTPEWINRWRPQVLLLSVAAGNKEGLPGPETLQAAAGYNLLRTDLNGWVEITTDGQRMWVEVQNP